MESFSAIKRNKLLIYARIWMNLKTIMLSVKRQSQKPTFFGIIYMNCPEQANLQRQKVH